MKVVILAGGKGMRLRPLTKNTQKAMLPVGSKPAIEHLVTGISKQGFNDIIITVNYLKEQIINHLSDGARLGVKINYTIEPGDRFLGTAGSTKLARARLGDTFIVFQGDAFTDIDVRKALAFHHDGGADVTIVLKQVPNPWLYGVSIVDRNSRITGFQERPPKQDCKSNLVSTGIYVLESDILNFVGDGNVDFAKDVFPRLVASDRKILGYVTDDFWVDIGSREGYLLANWRAMDKGCVSPADSIQLDETSRVTNPVYFEEDVKIDMFCSIGPYVALRRGSRVKEGSVIQYSVVFEDAIIGPGCRIESSVIDRLATLDRSSVVKESILGSQKKIKRPEHP